jgi:hypothetical protein
VVGCVDEVLIAVAAYATPFERALGVIAVRPRRSAHRYYVTGHAGAIETLDEAALLTA